MSKILRTILFKTTVVITYVAMIVMNVLATTLPLNNLTTGQISDSYPNIFAPAGLTFSIWGVIYLLLGAYTVYQLSTPKNGKLQTLISKVNRFFILSSIINAAWIVAWHYTYIWLSVLLMLSLLFCLIKIADLIRNTKLTAPEKLIIKVPFGIYFGWITIATIANITVFLVSLGWNGFGLSDTFWMIAVLIAGVVISGLRMFKDNSIAYGLVPVWAYFGILLKHTSPAGWSGAYPSVITTVWICIAILIALNGTLIFKKRAL